MYHKFFFLLIVVVMHTHGGGGLKIKKGRSGGSLRGREIGEVKERGRRGKVTKNQISLLCSLGHEVPLTDSEGFNLTLFTEQ